MKTSMKYALVTVLTTGLIMPLAANAAGNNDETKSAPKMAMEKMEPKVGDFASLDKNKDGALSLTELEKAYGGNITKASKEFKKLDANKDHKLSAAEYEHAKMM